MLMKLEVPFGISMSVSLFMSLSVSLVLAESAHDQRGNIRRYKPRSCLLSYHKMLLGHEYFEDIEGVLPPGIHIDCLFYAELALAICIGTKIFKADRTRLVGKPGFLQRLAREGRAPAPAQSTRNANPNHRAISCGILAGAGRPNVSTSLFSRVRVHRVTGRLAQKQPLAGDLGVSGHRSCFRADLRIAI